MKYFIFISVVSSFLFAKVTDKDLERDLDQASVDIAKLGWDAVAYVGQRVPSMGTMVIDGLVDTGLRQYKPVADAIKNLEKTNPTNGAVVRDFSKTGTSFFKMYSGVAVDRSGRLYESSDIDSQLLKLGSKLIGFYYLGVLQGGSASELSMWLVNTGGDWLGQAAIDSAVDWRKLKSQNKTDDSFEAYFVANAPSALASSIVSTPVKSATGYAIGFPAKVMGDVTEIALLMLMGRVTRNVGENLEWTAEKNQPTIVAAVVTFSTSIVKSLFLTTGCKTMIDLSRLAREHLAQWLSPEPVSADL